MKQYLDTTRSPWYGFLFTLPLLALYQAALLGANAGSARPVINGADALIQGALGLAGLHGWLGTTALAAAVTGLLVYRLDRKRATGPQRWHYLGPVLAESSFYALLFGSVVASMTAALLPGRGFLQAGGGLNFGQKLATGLGAGLYEELVFRLLLMGSLLLLLRRAGWKPGAAAAGAVLVSSLAFSLFHYVGPLADPFEAGSFTFRFVAGIVLAGLFALRGFAVAAWTHSLYDVFLLLSGH